MRKIVILLTGALIVFLVNSCEVEKPERYFEVNGIRHELSVGFMDDWGTNTTGIVNTRYFAISLRTSEDFPRDYVSFFIASNSTQDLATGDYYYEYSAERGEFESLRVGIGARYDNAGVRIDGIVFGEECVDYDGVIRISRASNGNFEFFFDVDMTVIGDCQNGFPERSYKLYGKYNDDLILNAKVVYPDEY